MTINALIKEIGKKGISLSVDNDNLIMKAPKGELDIQIVEAIKSRKQELIKLLKSTDYTIISKAPLSSQYPLSPLQFDYWVLNKMEQMDAAHNIFNAFICEGTLNIDYLQGAFNKLIERHEILRTVFNENENGQAYQTLINQTPFFQITRYNLDGGNLNAQEMDLLISKGKATRFDLTKFPLFKVSVITLSQTKSIICCVFSHLIADGWSMPIVMKDVLNQYHNLQNKKTEKSLY